MGRQEDGDNLFFQEGRVIWRSKHVCVYILETFCHAFCLSVCAPCHLFHSFTLKRTQRSKLFALKSCSFKSHQNYNMYIGLMHRQTWWKNTNPHRHTLAISIDLSYSFLHSSNQWKWASPLGQPLDQASHHHSCEAPNWPSQTFEWSKQQNRHVRKSLEIVDSALWCPNAS